jgi:hypothetical protein
MRGSIFASNNCETTGQFYEVCVECHAAGGLTTFILPVAVSSWWPFEFLRWE